MRTMCKEGVLMTVIVNKRPESAAIRLRTGRYGVPRVIYGEASVKGAQGHGRSGSLRRGALEQVRP